MKQPPKIIYAGHPFFVEQRPDGLLDLRSRDAYGNGRAFILTFAPPTVKAGAVSVARRLNRTVNRMLWEANGRPEV